MADGSSDDIEAGTAERAPLMSPVGHQMVGQTITVKVVTFERTLDVAVDALATVSQLKAAIRRVAGDIDKVCPRRSAAHACWR